MTSTITSKGQTVVPKAIRDQFKLVPGTILRWQSDGDSLRVIKLEPSPASKGGLDWWRRLGRIPAAERDRRKVEPQ